MKIAKLKNVPEVLRFNTSGFVDCTKMKFFRDCPYFLGYRTCICNSNNWSDESPCNKCYKEGEYNPLNAGTKIPNGVVNQFKGEKCR